MNCPKCHKNISEDTMVCPYCHKVLALMCPNCHSYSKNAVCSKCGYIILEKCSKCGKLVPTNSEKCKCGFSTATSIGYNECEIDEFATVIINLSSLTEIRRVLGTHELYTKFLIKLNNLITAQLKGCNAQIIKYGNVYNINFCKELSFQTSVNKAVRLAVKLITSFTALNLNMLNQFSMPIKLSVTIIKKRAEELLINKSIANNIKLMIIKNESKPYLKGLQVILDQYCQDAIRDYKTDSLYSLDIDGKSIMFYELLLEHYIVPPQKPDEDADDVVKPVQLNKANKNVSESKNVFNIFDLNAKCNFIQRTTEDVKAELTLKNKIVALRGSRELGLKTSDIVKIYDSIDIKAIYVTCTEETAYKPWGLFEKIFKEYYKLSSTSGFIDKNTDVRKFNLIKQLVFETLPKNKAPEDSRFEFLELFVDFISMLKKYVIIIDGFEYIDDTSVQALELYFDKYMNVYTNFVFITNADIAVHSKIKGLLQTFLYTEITLIPNSMDSILSGMSVDASDFIQSFYFEKIKDNFYGSKLYFQHVVKYLEDKNVLTTFDNKLLVNNYNSIVIPKDFTTLIRSRLKTFSKKQDASMILAYSLFLGERLDYRTLAELGVNNVEENVKFLNSTGFTYSDGAAVYVNNYILIKPIIQLSLKKEVQDFIAKTILAKLGKQMDSASLMLIMCSLSMQKEQSVLLWKISQNAIASGDYDAYLKNCLGFLSLIDKVNTNISEEDLEKSKKEIYQNILTSLYAYSPAKIYSISYILLMDAIESNDDEKTIRLSNLMLQGALITSNYTHAKSLLYNILNKMPNSSLIVNGSVNTRYLLLSLINIEILYNTGDYQTCIDIADSILSVIKPSVIEKIKPASFSVNSFVSHLMDTFRLVGFAKLLVNSECLDDFFKQVESSLGAELIDKNCILAIKDFIAGKKYTPSNIENASPYEKVVFLILQELSNLKQNYKLFAQNIYQAKLLASDIHQAQLEYLCEILIAYAYAKAGVTQKANKILNDILQKAENTNIYNIVILVKYVIIKLKFENNELEDSVTMLNDILSELQNNKRTKIFYAMFDKLFIEIIDKHHLEEFDLISELQKMKMLNQQGNYDGIISREYIEQLIGKYEKISESQSESEITDSEKQQTMVNSDVNEQNEIDKDMENK